MFNLKEFKIYKPFTVNEFQKLLSYKYNVFMFIISNSFLVVVTYYLWKSIYASSSTDVINEFNFKEMSIYVLISFIIGILTSCNVGRNVAQEVKDGSISINLLRPIDFMKRMLAQSLGELAFNFLVLSSIALIFITILYINFGGSFTFIKIILFILSLILGFLINFYFSYCFGLLAFKITNLWGIHQVMDAIIQLFSGALIPLSFFPNFAQKLMDFFPFSSIIYTPTMIYLDKFNSLEIVRYLGIQFIWVIIGIFFSKFIWKKVIKHLVILGG